MPRKKRSPKKKIKILRWIVSLAALLIAFYLSENQEIEEIRPNEVPVLFANACQDNLEEVFVDAIQSAKRSVLLIIYSLSDTRLIRVLNDQAKNGVKVKVIHDITTPAFGFNKLCSNIDCQGIKISGLMHQKILVIDKEKVWLGSANMTAESLKLHDNLVIGLVNQQLAEAIEKQKPFAFITVGGQPVEYWNLPYQGKEGLNRLIQLLDTAQKTIRVAMFTWTHMALTDAIIRAHQRGVKVEVLLDRGQAHGVCRQAHETLLSAGIDVRVSSGLGLLHHKFAWIDETYLVNGSANWTASAFTRNRDCFLILHTLTETQNTKMQTLWKKTKALSDKEHLPILGKGPEFIGYHLFELIDMAA